MLITSASAQVTDGALLGERIVEGEASPSKIWLRNAAGAVIEFSRSDGSQRVLARDGVIDLTRRGTQLLGLGRTRASEHNYHVLDLVANVAIAPPLTIRAPLALLVSEEEVVIVASDAVYFLENAVWRAQALDRSLRSAPQISVASTTSGKIYVGYNFGEWGGGLQEIDARTGAVSEVQRVDSELCGGVLNRSCHPITAVVRDRGRPNCILASVGLAHMGLHEGRVLRVCDSAVEVIFEENVPQQTAPPGYMIVQLPGTWPLFDLVTTSQGWAAVSQGRIFIAAGSAVASIPTPPLRQWNSLQMAELDNNLIVVRTDLNWGVSASGYTPLLIEVAP